MEASSTGSAESDDPIAEMLARHRAQQTAGPVAPPPIVDAPEEVALVDAPPTERTRSAVQVLVMTGIAAAGLAAVVVVVIALLVLAVKGVVS